MTPEFRAWPKTPRMFREIVISEKIDGTNAAVIVQPDGDGWFVGAQSRKRVITPESDNFGFAKWVRENAQVLAETLGEGYHFGEWWGSGIQRGYGLTKGERRFSLFNVNRYAGVSVPEIGLGVVPVLYSGEFTTAAVRETLEKLKVNGSSAAPGFMDPEGVITFHSAAGTVFKTTLEHDDSPKGQ